MFKSCKSFLLFWCLFWCVFAQAGTKAPPKANTLINPVTPYTAPALSGIDGWINSSPLSLNELKGRVVLLDFWTSSCSNCIQTFPYLNDWYAKYKDLGLTVIGVHSPEFDYEKSTENVRRRVAEYGITYPVVLDNRQVNWQNYQTRAWPTVYLIDKQGKVVYQHVGEGDYVTIENNIRYLLGMTPNVAETPPVIPLEDLTPTIYVGYSRAKNYATIEDMQKDTTADYTFPMQLALSSWALQGSWQILPDKAITMANNTEIKIHFKASKVFALMGAPGKTVRIQISVEKADGAKEVKQIAVSENKLYRLVNGTTPIEGMLTLKPDTAGLEVYTFTFQS